jgi:hypothetical protein
VGDVRFSNRRLGVKRFQTIHHDGVDVAHGLALLFGIGTKALPEWGSRTKWNNLSRGLAMQTAGRSKRTYDLTPLLVRQSVRNGSVPRRPSAMFGQVGCGHGPWNLLGREQPISFPPSGKAGFDFERGGSPSNFLARVVSKEANSESIARREAFTKDLGRLSPRLVQTMTFSEALR